MNLFFLLLILIMIIFFPIPIIIRIYISLDDYYINIYNLTIISKRKLSNKKVKEKSSNKIPPKNKLFNKEKFQKLDYKNLISKLYNSKFKPILRIKINLDYSMSDAAKTAIFYGVLSNLEYILNIIFNIGFITKHFKFKINPIFKDEYLLKFETKSIIFLSIANIIYMMVFISKVMLTNKEVAPNK